MFQTLLLSIRSVVSSPRPLSVGDIMQGSRKVQDTASCAYPRSFGAYRGERRKRHRDRDARCGERKV